MRKQETKNVITELETYLESFSEFEKRAAGHNLPWLRSLREDAFARFCQVGFPTTHDEDWRFTNVSSIARTPFRLGRNGFARVSQKEFGAWRGGGGGLPLAFVEGGVFRAILFTSEFSGGREVK